MPIFVSGSIAYDRIMTFPGRFADHIMPDKIHVLNVSFTVTGMVERPGGTAGNIAYALALLGEEPVITATIGRDCQQYFEWLTKHGIRHDGIRVIEDELTASAYITTDQADNQITGFNPGAMKQPSRYDLNGVDAANSIGIIAAGNLEDMMGYRDAFFIAGIPYVFDPAQSLPLWDHASLTGCITGAKVLISNDYEMEMIMKATGLDRAGLLDRAGAVIITRGEHGSVVLTRDAETVVPAVPCGEALVDPTGAGDAYRGGLIRGLLQGRGLDDSARLGTVAASFAVEVHGTQEYRFTSEQFEARLQDHFGLTLAA